MDRNNEEMVGRVPRFVDKKTEITTISNMFNPGLKVKVMNDDFNSRQSTTKVADASKEVILCLYRSSVS